MDIKTLLDLSPAELARRIGVSPQAISKWEKVPPDRVIEVCRITGWRVSPHQIREDLYPHPQDGLPPELRGVDPSCVSAPPEIPQEAA